MKAVLFDLDGVIIDTERVGHRVAFNEAFAKCGYPDVVWDEDFYHQLLQVGGGKERTKYYFSKYYTGTNPPEDMDEFAKKMHQLKTDIFVQKLSSLPLRSGVHRFMTEWKNKGVKMGICTTSNERVAETVGKKILHDIPFEVIIAGDMVKTKKPAPDIYMMAMEMLHVSPKETLVIEDSHIGVTAAKAAGCVVLATYNGYTQGEDLSGADFLVSCLGDPDGEKAHVVRGLYPIGKEGVVRASDFTTHHS